MTFLMFAPPRTRWLGWRKTEHPEGTAWVDFRTFSCILCLQSYLWYSLALRVINDILLSSCFLKVMHQKTLVKCRRSYKVRITVYIYSNRLLYIYKHLKNLPDTSSQIFDWKQFARHSFSLFGGISFSRERMFYESNESMSHESWVNESDLKK